MSLFSLEGVNFSYERNKPILQAINLSIREGSRVGLVGESGSGKSTLLRLLLGLARPNSGELCFNDVALNTRDAGYMREFRKQVQAVFQDPYSSLDPRQTVEKIIGEPLRSLKIAGDHKAMVRQALIDVGLDADVAKRYPHQFSGGQRQRIAIARAIVARPKVLLADEAVSALDLSTKIRIVELLHKLSRDMTLIFVSHDMGVVAALCDEIVVLEHGIIVEAGPTAQILAAPKHEYTKKLLGSIPRMPSGF